MTTLTATIGFILLASLALGEDKYIEQPNLWALLKKNQYLLSVDTFGGEGKKNLLPNYLSSDLDLVSVMAWNDGILFVRDNVTYYPFSSSPLPDIRKIRDAQSLSDVILLLAGKDQENLRVFKKTNRLDKLNDFSRPPIALGFRSAHLYGHSLAIVDCLLRYEFKGAPPTGIAELLTLPTQEITVQVRISADLLPK